MCLTVFRILDCGGHSHLCPMLTAIRASAGSGGLLPARTGRRPHTHPVRATQATRARPAAWAPARCRRGTSCTSLPPPPLLPAHSSVCRSCGWPAPALWRRRSHARACPQLRPFFVSAPCGGSARELAPRDSQRSALAYPTLRGVFVHPKRTRGRQATERGSGHEVAKIVRCHEEGPPRAVTRVASRRQNVS